MMTLDASSLVLLVLMALTSLVMGMAPPILPSSSSTLMTSPSSSFPIPSPPLASLPSLVESSLAESSSFSSSFSSSPSSSSPLPAEPEGTVSAAFLCNLLCPRRTVTRTVTETLVPTLPMTSATTPAATDTTIATDTTVSTSATDTSTSTSSADSSHPTLECVAQGYLIQDKKLLKVDLKTGSTQTLAQHVGGSGLDINALGFNSIDGWLYGLQGPSLVRIAADGFVESVVGSVMSLSDGQGAPAAKLGDIDGDGQYHFSVDGAVWGQIDLVPTSATYGQVVANGTSDTKGLLNLSDWASSPLYPGFLYSLALDNRIPTLARWSTSSHEWEIVYDKYIKSGPPFVSFGAIMATSDGFIYASENAVGTIVSVNIHDPEDISAVAGPTATSNSGARCALVPA